jgi:type IV pilus assembly protein PilX
MKRNRHNRTVETGTGRRQRGVALVISLLLFLVVTIVGIAGIRGTILQERMAGGAYDRGIGFQAAEAALMLGAQDFINNPAQYRGLIASNASLDCSNRTCAVNPEDDVAGGLWNNVPGGANATGFQPLEAGNPPQYVVQLLGDCSVVGGGGNFIGTTDQNTAGGGGGSQLNDQGTCYRITARSLNPAAAGNVNAERAQVILQATYRM